MQQGLSVSILLFMIYLTMMLTALTIQFAAVVRLTNCESESTQYEEPVASSEAFSWYLLVRIEKNTEYIATIPGFQANNETRSSRIRIRSATHSKAKVCRNYFGESDSILFIPEKLKPGFCGNKLYCTTLKRACRLLLLYAT
jgi:hypothetical protein